MPRHSIRAMDIVAFAFSLGSWGEGVMTWASRVLYSTLAQSRFASAAQTITASCLPRVVSATRAAMRPESCLCYRFHLRRMRRWTTGRSSAPYGHRRMGRVSRSQSTLLEAFGLSSCSRRARAIGQHARLSALHLRCDNGPEFVTNAILNWVVAEGIETAFIDPGKPGRMARTRASTGAFVMSVYHSNGFVLRPPEATTIIEAWRKHYNDVRPHSSLGYLTPNEFKKKYMNSTSSPRGSTSKGCVVQ